MFHAVASQAARILAQTKMIYGEVWDKCNERALRRICELEYDWIYSKTEFDKARFEEALKWLDMYGTAKRKAQGLRVLKEKLEALEKSL